MKSSFFFVILLGVASSYNDQTVDEDLYITHLPDARTLAHFVFRIQWDIHPLLFSEPFQGQSKSYSV